MSCGANQERSKCKNQNGKLMMDLRKKRKYLIVSSNLVGAEVEDKIDPPQMIHQNQKGD
jgi:hypothetical protein